jgi:hypothetical protein
MYGQCDGRSGLVGSYHDEDDDDDDDTRESQRPGVLNWPARPMLLNDGRWDGMAVAHAGGTDVMLRHDGDGSTIRSWYRRQRTDSANLWLGDDSILVEKFGQTTTMKTTTNI